jgi:hypothetical protein
MCLPSRCLETALQLTIRFERFIHYLPYAYFSFTSPYVLTSLYYINTTRGELSVHEEVLQVRR